MCTQIGSTGLCPIIAILGFRSEVFLPVSWQSERHFHKNPGVVSLLSQGFLGFQTPKSLLAIRIPILAKTGLQSQSLHQNGHFQQSKPFFRATEQSEQYLLGGNREMNEDWHPPANSGVFRRPLTPTLLQKHGDTIGAQVYLIHMGVCVCLHMYINWYMHTSSSQEEGILLQSIAMHMGTIPWWFSQISRARLVYLFFFAG